MASRAEPGAAALDRAVRIVAWVVAGVVLVVVLWFVVGRLRAPWIAEDAAILERVASDGPWADWTRSQYGLELVRFWRPVVSTAWGLQERWTGIDPLPLRVFNLLAHAGVALLVVACARRLGCAPFGAFVAGAWVASFPEQGGTVTWLAGRTDLLVALFLLACVWTALGRFPLASAPLAFLACASKEFGFLAPAWVFVLARARGDQWRDCAVRAAPAAAATLLALLWRRAALGGFGGGYPFEPQPLGSGLVAAARALGASALPSLLGVALLVAAGLLLGTASARALGWAACAVLLALVPLYPLLDDGLLEPQNRRLLFVAECGLALIVGLALPRSGERRLAIVVAVLSLLVIRWRFDLAGKDWLEWEQAAEAGEQRVLAARVALIGTEHGTAPVLFADFPVSYGGAYGLGWGLASRFRAPFQAAPRPVWPWRLVFAPQPEREAQPACRTRSDGSVWPLDDPLLVPALSVEQDGAPLGAPVSVDERVFLGRDDRSPRLSVRGPPGARLVGLFFTELGYEPVLLGELDAAGARDFTLKQALDATNGVASGAQVLSQAADVGATRAYLELRAKDAAGRDLAASRWIELVWPADLLRRSLSGG